MQVKTFEAKSVKEALKLVKLSLGPEAIVLSTKNKWGPWGEKAGIEIVATVSEGDLQKKKFAESKLKRDTKKTFTSSPARHQKEFIEKVFQDYKQSQKKSFQTTKIPYASILDEKVDFKEEPFSGSSSSPPPSPSSKSISTFKKPPFFLKRRWIGSNVYKKMKDESSKNQLTNDQLKKEKLLRDASSHKSLKGLLSKERSSVLSSSPSPSPSRSSPLSQESSLSDNLAENFSVHELFKKSKYKDYDFLNLKFIKEKLLNIGLNEKNRDEILSLIQKESSKLSLKSQSSIEAYVAGFFLNHIEVCSHPSKEKFHFFIGPSGTGKTTSLIKTLCQTMVEFKKSVAVINTNTSKIGSSKSLETFSKILNIPFIEFKEAKDLEKSKETLSSIDFVFIDSPGLKSKTVSEIKEKISFFPKESLKVHYVQSLLFNEKNTFEIASEFKTLFHDVIFSHLDESDQYGMIYNFQKMFKVPLHSFGFGESIPEDFEWATKERFVDLVFKLVDWSQNKDVS